ncbi:MULTISPECIES: glycoside hydrolase family 3 N-terminal domain-containing protein [Nocardia]|uniref:glycoside hydrolase family 3 N-terminal domain-containing protein n=1 Tax=Nocardia TaxID=1817 RepID=UPI0026585DEB|nr:glycoside hydrolase family 3 N-terminal domain-containing protein [Nocardia sp. PE-7]WKG09417.1 glycoside hydrolase family 3 N-terminal domain-containing protein [Nocardia sp. PE-7]
MRKSPVVVFAVLAAVATACSGGSSNETTPAASSSGVAAPSAAGEPSSPASATPIQSNCGADYLAKLSQREKLAQLLTVGITGSADASNVVSSEQVGGIFVGSWTDPGLLDRAALDAVKAQAKVPLMVTIDEEGGRVSRAKNVIGAVPSAREIAQTQTPEQFYQLTLTRSKALKDVGITVDFAPDVDVSSQPDDSVIGDRSFSDDPKVVSEFAGAYIRASNEVGLGSVIKHFPGHGSGSGDSHTGAVTTPPLDQLQTTDLVPFRDLVNSGAAVMVGHLDVPGLTDPGVPASISPAAMTLLREGTGYGAPPFNGPIFTDDLSGMAAITARMSIVDAVEATLVAGADNALWISSDAVPQVLDRLEQSVSSGKLPADRVDTSVLRMARYKGVALGC